MQAIAPVTKVNLLGKVQEMAYKLEIYDADTATWHDLCDLDGKYYLKDISLSLGGAGMSPDPISGTWSAVIDNENGIFHPKHPTSSYADLLRIGRQVRISVGGVYGGFTYLWQRLIGYMDVPRFNHGTRTVEISGCDYMKNLADTSLYSPYTHWGSSETYTSVASPGGTGSEIYAEADACEVGVNEADNVNNWVEGGTGGATDSIAGEKSNFTLEFERDAPGPTIQYTANSDVGNVTAGTQYVVSFWSKNLGDHNCRMLIYQTVGGSPQLIGEEWCSDSGWVYHSKVVTVTATGAMQLAVSTGGKYAANGDVILIDEISIKNYDTESWMRYELPDTCNGPYLVELDDDPVWQGDEDGKISWHYNETENALYFSEDSVIDSGLDLDVYFYTDQLVDNVVADLLVAAHYYADRATALAAMDYTPTGITLERVWFGTGTKALNAIKMICERCNYRFWFAYDGTPNFHPAPDAESPIFIFDDTGALADVQDFQDLNEVRNKVVIEGMERAMYSTREEKHRSYFTGNASDATSIATYLERSHSIRNHLFQDQTSVDDMAAELLFDFKDPKLYSDLRLDFLPIPLELGDTISWWVEVAPGWGSLYGEAIYGEVVYGTANIRLVLLGIIRDISINNGTANYKCEVVEAYEDEEEESGSGADESGSGSGEAGSGSAEATVEEYTTSGEWICPTGVTEAVVETWAGAGGGGDSDDPVQAAGGGGGGAYARATIGTTPGNGYDYNIGAGGGPGVAGGDTTFYDDDDVTVLCEAVGGEPGDDADIGGGGGAGGAAGDCTGDVTYSGGDGADGSASSGGGGGSSAGSASNGDNGVGPSGGTAPYEGGDGGDGGASDNNGNPGSQPGGAGGGAGRDIAASPQGGSGAKGKVRITYY